MKIITTLSLLFIGLCAFAQNVSLTIFNNNGQQFFVIMNGIRQNSIPQTSVKIGGMTTGAYELKLIFADGKTGDINKKIYVDVTGDYLARVVFKGKKRKLQWFGMADGTQPVPAGGTNIQYRPNDQSVYSDQSATMNNGQYGAPVQTGNTQQTGTYQTGQAQTSGQASQQGSATTQTGQIDMNTQVVITDPNMSGQAGQTGTGIQTTTTTTGSQTGQTNGTVTTGTTVTDPNMSNGQAGDPNGQFGVNININVQDPTMNGGTGGIGMTTTTTGSGQTQTMGTSTTISDPNANGQFGVDMNVTGTGLGQGTATSTSTSSSSSTTTQNGQVVNDSHTYQQTTSVTQNGQTTTTSQSSQSGNGSQGTNYQTGQTTMTTGTTVVPTGGSYSCTMVLADADAFITQLNAATFDADKREMIETDLKSYCMTSDQAYRIIHALTFDADRLDMSKFLYDRMTDKVNGKRLLELLTFELDQDEFKQYMQTH